MMEFQCNVSCDQFGGVELYEYKRDGDEIIVAKKFSSLIISRFLEA